MLTTGIAVAALSILAACGGTDANAQTPDEDSAAQQSAEEVENTDPANVWGEYKTVAISGKDESVEALFDGKSIKVSFHEKAGLQINAPCNGMSSQVSLDNGKVELGKMGLTQTLIGCPGERADQDEWLREFFESTPSWELAETTLTLKSDVGTVSLEKQSGE